MPIPYNASFWRAVAPAAAFCDGLYYGRVLIVVAHAVGNYPKSFRWFCWGTLLGWGKAADTLRYSAALQKLAHHRRH